MICYAPVLRCGTAALGLSSKVLRGELKEEFKMNENLWSSRGLWLVCGGLGLALGSNSALADPAAGVADPDARAAGLVVQADSSEITVTRVAQGSPVHVVSLARRVSYGDLNMNTPTASAELERRIGDAAVDICKRLDERFPDARPNGRACIETAVKEALRKVHAGESNAQRKART
jgi:UrcA family protein